MRYTFVEARRAFLSWRFILAVSGVVFAHFYSIYKMAGINGSVYKTYEAATYFTPYLVSITLCALPYAQGFCEDFKQKFINQVLVRCGLKRYVFIKCFFIFISSMAVMILGTAIFILLVRCSVPWAQPDDIRRMDKLGSMLQGHYMLYYIVRSFFTSMLAAGLALLSSYLSLYWQSSFLIMSTPFLFLYMTIFASGFLFPDTPQANIAIFFNPAFDVWNNLTASLLYPLIVTGISVSFLVTLIYIKVRKILWGK